MDADLDAEEDDLDADAEEDDDFSKLATKKAAGETKLPYRLGKAMGFLRGSRWAIEAKQTQTLEQMIESNNLGKDLNKEKTGQTQIDKMQGQYSAETQSALEQRKAKMNEDNPVCVLYQAPACVVRNYDPDFKQMFADDNFQKDVNYQEDRWKVRTWSSSSGTNHYQLFLLL